MLSGDVEELAVALRLEKVVVATTGGGAPYALGVASYVPERVQGMLLISPLLSAGAVLQCWSQCQRRETQCVRMVFA